MDFVIVESGKATLAIECKLGDDQIARGLSYFAERLPGCRCWQISATGTKDYVSASGVRVCPAGVFLRDLV